MYPRYGDTCCTGELTLIFGLNCELKGRRWSEASGRAVLSLVGLKRSDAHQPYGDWLLGLTLEPADDDASPGEATREERLRTKPVPLSALRTR